MIIQKESNHNHFLLLLFALNMVNLNKHLLRHMNGGTVPNVKEYRVVYEKILV